MQEMTVKVGSKVEELKDNKLNTYDKVHVVMELLENLETSWDWTDSRP